MEQEPKEQMDPSSEPKSEMAEREDGLQTRESSRLEWHLKNCNVGCSWGGSARWWNLLRC
ncbi:MAG: hypothetical protein R3B38_01480 [Patescibacteria group bacterium]